MSAVDVYAIGICHVSICAPNTMTREEALLAATNKHPTGLDHPWAFSDEPSFRTGQPNPCPCDQRPETHSHYLLVC